MTRVPSVAGSVGVGASAGQHLDLGAPAGTGEEAPRV